MFEFIAALFNLPVETSHSPIAMGLVLVGILCIAVGWLKILHRRQNRRFDQLEWTASG